MAVRRYENQAASFSGRIRAAKVSRAILAARYRR